MLDWSVLMDCRPCTSGVEETGGHWEVRSNTADGIILIFPIYLPTGHSFLRQGLIKPRLAPNLLDNQTT